MADSLPRIAVIGTGGTISSLGAGSLDVLDYPEFGQKLTSEALLDCFPETRQVAEPVPITFRQVGSTAIGPKDWLELRELIHRTAGEDPSVIGFVIPHGTATLEETAFFLNLTLGIRQPVVLVGAQRPASALGSDAGMNLVNALRVAGCPEARGKGVLVVLNDEIHPARDVVKTSTYRVQTFRSFDFGALVKAAAAAGARGLVSAGFAPGSPSPEQREAFIEAARSGVVVVQCSRAASGRVAPRRHLRETGLVAGEDFSPQKARILLMLLLTTTGDIAEIQNAFQTY
jgi:L-asparaginase